MTNVSPTTAVAQAFIPVMLANLQTAPNSAIFPASIFSAMAPLAIGASGPTVQDMCRFFKVAGVQDIENHLGVLSALLNGPATAQPSMTYVSRDAFLYQLLTNEALTQRTQDFLGRYPSMFMSPVSPETATEVLADGNAHLLKGMESVAIDPELLKLEYVTPDTVLVLANRSMAEWKWRTAFTDLRQMGFTAPDGLISVPGLTASILTMCEAVPGGTLLAVPVVDASAQFFIFLPHQGFVEQGTASTALARMAEISADPATQIPGQYLTLTMPSMVKAIRTCWDVQRWADVLGLEYLFVTGEYDGIIAKLRAYASVFKHNSSLEWDKVGGRAVGETVIGMFRMTACLPATSVVVDRPFLTALYSRGVCISTAIVTDPSVG